MKAILFLSLCICSFIVHFKRKFDPKCLKSEMIKKWMYLRYNKSIMSNISWNTSNECVMEVFRYFKDDIRFCERLIRQICKGNVHITIHDVFGSKEQKWWHRYSEIRSFLVNEASVKVQKFVDFEQLNVCFPFVFSWSLHDIFITYSWWIN